MNQLELAGDLPDNGYYHDLQNCRGLDLRIEAIGTANYNNLVETISRGLGFGIPKVQHLNGGVTDYYNPYKNSIISCENINDIPSDQIYIPFILTQSGLKPLTSVDMSRRYVGLFDEYQNCDAIAVVGYGFNKDDSHINGLFRKLVEEEGKRLYWVCSEQDGTEEDQKRSLLKKLRIAAEFRQLINVLPVDADTRSLGGQNWLEAIAIDSTK